MLQGSAALRLSTINNDDKDIVGAKAVQLGELIRAGFGVPEGFVIPAPIYFQFLKENRLQREIIQLLKTVNFESPESVMQVSSHIKKRILHAPLSPALVNDISNAYEKFGGLLKNAEVAISPSPTVDDLLRPSFYGPLELILSVTGEANLILSIRTIWASLFTPQTLLYRHQHHLDHFRAGVGIIVQKMVNAEKSGIIYTTDPITNDKSTLIIEAFYGSSHIVDKQHVLPDHYEVSKKHLIVLKQEIVRQDRMLIREKGNEKIISVPEKKAREPKLDPQHIKILSLLGNKLEKHLYFPQEIQWAIEKNTLYILKTQNLTSLSSADNVFSKQLLLLLRGKPLTPHLAIGPVKIVTDVKDMNKINRGDIVVVPNFLSEYKPVLKKASALISEGSEHDFHETKETSVPVIIGAENATKILRPGMVVTVDGGKGEIYKGSHHSSSHSGALRLHHSVLKTRTKIFTHITDLSQTIDTSAGLSEGLFILHQSKLELNEYASVDAVGKQLIQICQLYHPIPVFYQLASPLSESLNCERDITVIKTLREKKKVTNLSILFPPLTIEKEVKDLKQVLNNVGLHRSASLQQWMLINTPAQCIMFDPLSQQGIDGVVIDIEALTQHTLGIQHGKQIDELHPSVVWSLEQILKTARRSQLPTCVLFASSFIRNSFLEKMVRIGVTGVSVLPTNKNLIRNALHEIEKKV